jgi:hypothetical protein
MRWLKSLGLSSSANRASSRPAYYGAHLETLEVRQMLSIDPVVALDANDEPIVQPLAAVSTDQNIQDTWQATPTATLSVSENTGEKPQSKVWTNGGEWFAVLPNSSGTWIWRLDGTDWTPVLKLSTSNSTHADVKTIGDVTHVLLFDGANTQLASVQYVAASHSYEFWSARPANVNLPLPNNSETATIDVDSLGRMWVCYENKAAKTVEVRYSDNNYATWSNAITVASGIGSDDIASIIALPTGQIGVFWSNQNTSRFGFRTHDDDSDPNSWNAAEIPAAQSGANKLADDHMHLAAASDGTLYVAAKTSFDKSGSPEIILLVRRPNGSWDSIYAVAGVGTRPTITINEQLNRLIVAYTNKDGGGDILYRESPLDNISLSAAKVLIGGSYNDVSTTKQSFTDQLLVIASTSSKVKGVLLESPGTPSSAPSAPTNQAPLVSAGSDRSTKLGTPVALDGSANDDGLPGTALTITWSQVSGPGQAIFGNENQAATDVTFSAVGTYVLRLTVSDGELTSTDDVTVTVTTVVVVNHAPAGANKTVSVVEDGSYTFTAADFGFSDPNDSPANSLAAVKITTLPAAGSLTVNGVAVTAGQFITVADIAGGKLKYAPPINVTGPQSSSFTFQVQDDGGTANGGVNLDASPNTITLTATLSPTLNFVRGLYTSILNRAADQGGLIFWSNQLRGGASNQSIVNGLWNSVEHRGIQVDGFYQTYLGRKADAGGRQNWINVMLGGMTEEQVASAFVVTPEYRQKYSTNSAYVTGVYQDLLNRKPTSSEKSNWNSKLTNGSATPAQLVQSLMASHERHLQLVDGFYQEYFNRKADKGGETFWTGELDKSARTQENVEIELLSSVEYYNLRHS